ncbi:hypothetical protein ACWIGW_45555 [Nocardia brasiliensis]
MPEICVDTGIVRGGRLGHHDPQCRADELTTLGTEPARDGEDAARWNWQDPPSPYDAVGGPGTGSNRAARC